MSQSPADKDELSAALRARADELPDQFIFARGLMRMAADRLTALEARAAVPECGRSVEQEIVTVLRDFGEIPDRTSPEDFPEGYVLTREEIIDGIRRVLAVARSGCGTTNAAGQAVPVLAGQDHATAPVPQPAPAAPSAPLTGTTPRTCACCNRDCHGERERLERELAAARSTSGLCEELAAANRSLDWCGQQLAACAPYVKNGETVPQAMERNWQDSQNVLGELSKERLKCEALEMEIGFARTAYDQLFARHDQEIERAKAIPAQAEAAISTLASALRRLYDAFPDCEGGEAGEACTQARAALSAITPTQNGSDPTQSGSGR